MTKHRSHSAAFKRQVAEEFIAGETLHALSKRHDISRQLIRIWVGKFEAGALDDDVQAADLLQEYEAKIAALERMVRRQALEIESKRCSATLGSVSASGWVVGLPIPRHQFIDAPLRPAVHEARQHVGEPGLRIDSFSLAVYAARRTMPNGLVFPRNGRDLDVIGSA